MIWTYITNGLSVGMVYALVAVGYSMVFGILRLINFSHGSVYAFGAQMALVFIGLNFGVWWALFFSILSTGVLAVLVNKLTLEPLRKKKAIPIASLIATIGVFYIIQNLLIVFLGSEKRMFPNFYSIDINLGNFPMTSTQLVLFIVSLLLLLILTLIVNKTKIGLAMRAVQQSPETAAITGINVNNIITFTFLLGGISAAIASSLIGGYYQLVYPTMGSTMGMKAFSAAVLGGIGILHGSVVGGLIIGVIESIAVGYLGGTYRDAFAFVILIIILLIKPSGIFGKKTISKV